jgi:hypothetical protein
VDDNLIVFNQNNTNEMTIINHTNNIDKHLEFKISEEEESNSINYLDFSNHRNTNSINISIYRKLTHTDITIQFSSIHPYGHKLAIFNCYTNRMLGLPITKQTKQQEWQITLTTAQNNGFLKHIIPNLEKKSETKKRKTKTPNNPIEQEMDNTVH